MQVPRVGWATAFRRESSYVDKVLLRYRQLMQSGTWSEFPTATNSQMRFWASYHTPAPNGLFYWTARQSGEDLVIGVSNEGRYAQ